MRIHFFSRANISGRSAFRSHYIRQNLRVVKTVSLIFFAFTLLLRFLFFSFNISYQTTAHINEYNAGNWIALIVSPIFYIIGIQAFKNFKPTEKVLRQSQLLVFLFAMFVITSAMRASFFSMHNPRNTLLMYMLGLIIISAFFTFEYYETLFIMLTTGICFSILLPYYQHALNEQILNNVASLLLLTVFFCVSRYLYSYRADNFFKIRAIEEKNLEINNASNAKNEILGIVAHDLRNPLAIIKSITMLMEMEDHTAEDYHEHIGMIKSACDKATSIIHDLIETAQNEIPNQFNLEKTELGDFLSIVINEWLKNKKGQINIAYQDAGKPLYAKIHKEKMQRVMDNLIINAIKFSDENSNIDISLSHTNDDIFIRVRDYGIGIPDDMLPYIFDRFSKARRNGVRGEASVGLGLSIVHQIVKKHDGEIVVNSGKNEGTTFTIALPHATV
jgi:two-component system, OmpR family, sensor histidine kinase VicK